MRAISHTLAHRAPPASRTRAWRQPYSSLPPYVATLSSSSTSGSKMSPPAPYSTPATSAISSFQPNPSACDPLDRSGIWNTLTRCIADLCGDAKKMTYSSLIAIEGQKRFIAEIFARKKLRQSYECECSRNGLSSSENILLFPDSRNVLKVATRKAQRLNFLHLPVRREIEKNCANLGLEFESVSHSTMRGLSGRQKVKVVLDAATWRRPRIIASMSPPTTSIASRPLPSSRPSRSSREVFSSPPITNTSPTPSALRWSRNSGKERAEEVYEYKYGDAEDGEEAREAEKQGVRECLRGVKNSAIIIEPAWGRCSGFLLPNIKQPSLFFHHFLFYSPPQSIPTSEALSVYAGGAYMPKQPPDGLRRSLGIEAGRFAGFRRKNNGAGVRSVFARLPWCIKKGIRRTAQDTWIRLYSSLRSLFREPRYRIQHGRPLFEGRAGRANEARDRDWRSPSFERSSKEIVTTQLEPKKTAESDTVIQLRNPRPKAKKKKKSKPKRKSKVQVKESSAGASSGAKKVKKKAGRRAASESLPAEPSPAPPLDPSVFKEASDYISSFLSSPEARGNSVCRLTFLQSLIIELGLISSVLNLPASLNAATKFLKSKAFLNIREYMSVREQGQDSEAIRKVLYPSRSALIKALRTGKTKRASLQWVKDHGLQVLLVGCFH
ncbi:hypothetical protein NMY22_g19374 [Coprinellus aureogranulatus]|nr:hypothetical protein NMY22_g19374 [Coprinellus aureogranulatus]